MIDTRRYQWMIGGFGLMLVVAFSVYLYTHGGSTGPGLPAGAQVRQFVAPLAGSDLTAPANVSPVCAPARPARRGLNVCGREPLVLAFFAAEGRQCVRSVGVLQRVSRRFVGTEFAAVAIGSSHQAAARLVRRHHWRIPVAYDMTGAVGALYDVSVCPLIEVLGRDGSVSGRLIGDRWTDPARLTARLDVLLGAR